jgi:hypothetical protein
LLAVLVLRMLRESARLAGAAPVGVYLAAAGVTLATGIGVELAQVLSSHHNPSSADVASDLAGILIALGIYAAWDSRLASFWRQRPAMRRAVFILACVLLLVCILPLLQLAVAYRERAAAMPVIMDFGAGWATPFLKLRSASLTAGIPERQKQQASTGPMARLTLEPGKYPGVSVIEPTPNWTGYTALVLEIHSPLSTPLELVLRVHDRAHNQEPEDRFTRRLRLQPGENRFRIPLAEIESAPVCRSMDLSRIAGLILYVPALERTLVVHPETLRLE